MTSADDEPELAPPLPLAARQASRLASILLLLGVIGGGVYASTGTDHSEVGTAPSRSEELSANIVTFVAPDNRAGVAAAVAALKVPTAQRAEIAHAVLEGKRRIGWIVFTDSIDPDGDTIAVEGSGLIAAGRADQELDAGRGHPRGRRADRCHGSPRWRGRRCHHRALRPAPARCRCASCGPANVSRWCHDRNESLARPAAPVTRIDHHRSRISPHSPSRW